MLKNKKIILIVLAILFLVVIFILKNQTLFKNEETYKNTAVEGLVYSTTTVGDLVNKDTDGDGILDWEEGLWDTDPTKKDTNADGVSDDIEIAKLKTETADSSGSSSSSQSETLTETEKLSDQFFATIVALEQSGSLDETAIDQLTTSLVNSIQKVSQRKIYTIKNIKTMDESKSSMQAYNTKLQALQTKYPLNLNVTDVMEESLTADGDIDVSVFKKFDPVITQINGIVKDMLAMTVPKSLSILHVMVINGFQKLSENLSDIKLADTDSIRAFGAINQYEKNSASLGQYVGLLISAVTEKLKN